MNATGSSVANCRAFVTHVVTVDLSLDIFPFFIGTGGSMKLVTRSELRSEPSGSVLTSGCEVSEGDGSMSLSMSLSWLDSDD